MNNERAIELLHRLQDEQFDGVHGDERREALEMAVRALEPNIGQKTIDCIIKRLNDEDRITGDLISRKMVIETITRISGIRGDVLKALYDLPSAQPTQTIADSTHENTLDCVNRQQAINAVVSAMIDGADAELVEGVMELLPSAHPEIIRCKDCKMYDERPCGIVDYYNTANDFCSRGRRKDE